MHVEDMITWDHLHVIERVVRKLQLPPCANPSNLPDGSFVSQMSLDAVVDIFWNKFKTFQNKTDWFHNEARWNCPNTLLAVSHLWYEEYCLPYTAVLAFCGCRAISKICGIGGREHSWGDVKEIKDGKPAHMDGESVEKRAVLFTTTRINDTRIDPDWCGWTKRSIWRS